MKNQLGSYYSSYYNLHNSLQAHKAENTHQNKWKSRDKCHNFSICKSLFPGLQIIRLSAVGLHCIGKIGRNGQLHTFQLSGHVTLPFNCIWVYDYSVEFVKIKLLNTFQGFCSIEKWMNSRVQPSMLINKCTKDSIPAVLHIHSLLILVVSKSRNSD